MVDKDRLDVPDQCALPKVWEKHSRRATGGQGPDHLGGCDEPVRQVPAPTAMLGKHGLRIGLGIVVHAKQQVGLRVGQARIDGLRLPKADPPRLGLALIEQDHAKTYMGLPVMGVDGNRLMEALDRLVEFVLRCRVLPQLHSASANPG